MTPETIATIHRMADAGDPYWRGAAWMLDQTTTQETQNPPQD